MTSTVQVAFLTIMSSVFATHANYEPVANRKTIQTAVIARNTPASQSTNLGNSIPTALPNSTQSGKIWANNTFALIKMSTIVVLIA